MAIQKTVHFTAGEGLTHTDLENIGSFHESMLLDTWGQLALLPVMGQESSRIPKDDYCFALGSGGAPTAPFCAFYSSETGLKIKNRSGWIFQQIGTDTDTAPTGSTPTFIGYFLAENELQTTLTVNASGNARWDLLCVKLDKINTDPQLRDIEDATTRIITSQSVNKQAATRCQFQVVTGTPAASPVYPSVPAGYVKLAGIVVASGATNILPASIVDFRIPIGTWSADVYATDVLGNSLLSGSSVLKAGTWALLSGPARHVSATALAFGEAFVEMPLSVSFSSRLLAIQVFGSEIVSTTWNAKLNKLTRAGKTLLKDNLFSFPPSGAVFRAVWQSSVLDTPFWGDGEASGHAMSLSWQDGIQRDTDDEIGQLSVQMRAVVANSGDFNKIRFIFSGR